MYLYRKIEDSRGNNALTTLVKVFILYQLNTRHYSTENIFCIRLSWDYSGFQGIAKVVAVLITGID